MSISDTNTPDRRGQSEGSRKSQFSSENQPDRRRQARKRKDLKASFLTELQRSVNVTISGQIKAMPYIEVFSQSLAQEALKGTVVEKLKFLERLDKQGLTSYMADQYKLDIERAKVEEERRELAKQRRSDKLSAEVTEGLAEQWRRQWYAAARALTELSEACECGAHTEELAELIDTLTRTFARTLEDDERCEEVLEMLREDMRHPEGYDPSDDDDEDYEEGGVEIDPNDFDEEAMPNTGDPDDPALDIANGELTPEDLIPPAGSEDEGDQS